MRLLLDTHVLLWATLSPQLLPERILIELQNPRHELILSSASVWELAIKHRMGKLPEALPLLEDFPAVAARLGAEVIAMTAAHAVLAGLLLWDHRDPFDRMLVAQALDGGLQLVTLDRLIREHVPAQVFSGDT